MVDINGIFKPLADRAISVLDAGASNVLEEIKDVAEKFLGGGDSPKVVSIDEFKNRTKAGFARPTLFEVRIQLPWDSQVEENRGLSLNCYNAQIPGISLATTDKDIGYRSIAYQKLFDDVLLSFYCRENFDELQLMQTWMDKISNPVNNRFEYYSKYVSTIDIIHTSRGGEKTLTTTLHEAYPKKIDPMQLDYGSNDIMRMTVNFTYRHFTQRWGPDPKQGLSKIARRSDSKDNSIINELDSTFLGGGSSGESDIESNGGGDNF